MVEKKQYPSQINSKTISARIPVQDYVNFLNESLNLGISLNDFLLRKIYSNGISVGNVKTQDEELTAEILNFINDYDFQIVELENKEEYWNDEEGQNSTYNNPIQTDNILRVFVGNEGGGWYFYTVHVLVNWINGKNKHIEKLRTKTADLLDVKNQLTILIQDKFRDLEDRKSFRRELYSLLKELE
jgi:hypothetical protein